MLGIFDRFLSLSNLLNEALGLTINDGGARKCGPIHLLNIIGY